MLNVSKGINKISAAWLSDLQGSMLAEAPPAFSWKFQMTITEYHFEWLDQSRCNACLKRGCRSFTFQRRLYSEKSPGSSRFHLGLKFVCRNMTVPSGENCVIVLPRKAGLQTHRLMTPAVSSSLAR